MSPLGRAAANLCIKARALRRPNLLTYAGLESDHCRARNDLGHVSVPGVGSWQRLGGQSPDPATQRGHVGGTEIGYHAHFEFHGLAKLATPFLKAPLEKLGDDTEKQMRETINAL